MTALPKQKLVVVGAGPVGALTALYAASRGDDVEVYELRGGTFYLRHIFLRSSTPRNTRRSRKLQEKSRKPRVFALWRCEVLRRPKAMILFPRNFSLADSTVSIVQLSVQMTT